MIRPHNDYVIISRPVSPDITEGGIHLPTLSGRQKPTEGIVVAIGNGKKLRNGRRMPMQAQVGDRVIFRQYDVEKLKGIPEAVDDNGRPYIFLRDDEILGVLDKDADYKQGSNSHLR